MLTDSDIMAQVLAAFREEQAEHRQTAGEILLELEREPEHPQRHSLLDRLFREAHSLKGGARAAGQPEIEQIAHRIEDIFSTIRQGSRQITSDLCDLIYAALDAIGVLMNQVAAGQPADLTPYQPLLGALEVLLDDSALPPSAAERQDAPAPRTAKRGVAASKQSPSGHDGGQGARAEDHAPNGHPSITDHSAPIVAGATDARLRNAQYTALNGHTDADDLSGPGNRALPWDVQSSTVRLSTQVLDTILNEAGELVICTVGAEHQARQARDLAALPGRWRHTWRQIQPTLRRLRSRVPATRPIIHYLDDRAAPLPLTPASSGDHSTTMLVEALEQANTLIADLERRLSLHTRQLADDYSRLQAVSDRLHQQILRTRMLPLATIFSPLPLQLREMARAAGKHATLTLDDGGAEADRQILERLGEILLHLLRNAVDHGIEPADIRCANGKPSEGLITLRAATSGDRLTLTIADDGAGMDLMAIRQRAIAHGHVNEADLAQMSEAELIDHVFLPGFSTRQAVSALSGRGVGLDIVRSRVERMHGRVTFQSTPGAGCQFTLSLPLSLTRSHGLLLRAGTAVYALPLDMIRRIIPVTARDMRMLEGRATIVLDDRPVALAYLLDMLGSASTTTFSDTQATWYGLLLGSSDRQVVCLVDAVLGEQELVVHRLPMPLQQVRGIAGATTLADGKVVPILDASDLLRVTRDITRTMQVTAPLDAPAYHATVLVVDDSITTRTLEKNILEAAGYQVRLATGGAEALRLLDQLAGTGGCNLLLSDVDMPQLNGFELTARVRADTRFQHLPVILVTSLDTAEDRARGIAAGADAYIVKRQFEQQTLLDTIARLI